MGSSFGSHSLFMHEVILKINQELHEYHFNGPREVPNPDLSRVEHDGLA